MEALYFDNEKYNDDRMFVFTISKGVVYDRGDRVTTTIYHEEIPENYVWCVVTYRNVERYRGFKTNAFNTEEEAIAFLKEVEPFTPLISLNGESPKKPMSYDEYYKWKTDNKFKEYNYKDMFQFVHNSNPAETFTQFKKKNGD